MLEQFRHYVEQNAGWRLLRNDDNTPRRETASQLLLLGMVSHYCRANDIDITREPDVGRGPVDFKVSRGYQLRALIEVKLASNTRFWDGLKEQLPTYLTAEQTLWGYFVVVVQSDADMKRVATIQATVAAINTQRGHQIETILIDARPKRSASTLTGIRSQ